MAAVSGMMMAVGATGAARRAVAAGAEAGMAKAAGSGRRGKAPRRRPPVMARLQRRRRSRAMPWRRPPTLAAPRLLCPGGKGLAARIACGSLRRKRAAALSSPLSATRLERQQHPPARRRAMAPRGKATHDDPARLPPIATPIAPMRPTAMCSRGAARGSLARRPGPPPQQQQQQQRPAALSKRPRAEHRPPAPPRSVS